MFKEINMTEHYIRHMYIETSHGTLEICAIFMYGFKKRKKRTTVPYSDTDTYMPRHSVVKC